MNTKLKRWTKVHSTVLAVCALLAPAAWGSSGGPLGDTYVSPANDSLNFGNLGTIAVGPLGASNAPGNTGLFQFDLSNLPAGTTAANIGKATLTVYLNKVLVAGGLNFSQVSTPWSESAVTFATRPSGLGAFATNVPVSASGEYVTVDITNVVKFWVSGGLPNYGVEVTASLANPATSVVLDSKESTTTSHPAQLDITVVSQGPTGPQGQQGLQGQQGPQGQTGPGSNITYVSGTFDALAGHIYRAVADCGPGLTAIAGACGCATLDSCLSDFKVTSSVRNPTSPQSWFCGGINTGSATWTITYGATCMSSTPAGAASMANSLASPNNSLSTATPAQVQILKQPGDVPVSGDKVIQK
jgi:hypothetical protein